MVWIRVSESQDQQDSSSDYSPDSHDNSGYQVAVADPVPVGESGEPEKTTYQKQVGKKVAISWSHFNSPVLGGKSIFDASKKPIIIIAQKNSPVKTAHCGI